MEVLDIGCGSRPHGSTNMDLGLGTNEHHKFDYDVKEIQNFTRAALPHLPYRSEVFDLVFCSHVLEHIPEPLKALEEIHRVTRSQAVLIVPNHPVLDDHPTHLYSWSENSFKAWCSLKFREVEVRARCRYFQVLDYRLARRILKISLLRQPVARLISRIMAVEIVAVCKK